MVKKAEEKKDAQTVQGAETTQAGNDTQTTPDAATPEAAAPAAGENGNAAATAQEDVKDTGKADAAASATPPAKGDEGETATGKPDEEEPQPLLESLSSLADRHRVTSWQQAALMRCMGWERGKLVTDAEYRAALTRIKNRPMGGGRLA